MLPPQGAGVSVRVAQPTASNIERRTLGGGLDGLLAGMGSDLMDVTRVTSAGKREVELRAKRALPSFAPCWRRDAKMKFGDCGCSGAMPRTWQAGASWYWGMEEALLSGCAVVVARCVARLSATHHLIAPSAES
jgi:hypothetical protein